MSRRRAFHSMGREDEAYNKKFVSGPKPKQAALPLGTKSTSPPALGPIIPFCPLDPEEKHVARRDPLLNFLGGRR